MYQDTDQESGPGAASKGPKAAAAGNASSNCVQGNSNHRRGPCPQQASNVEACLRAPNFLSLSLLTTVS